MTRNTATLLSKNPCIGLRLATMSTGTDTLKTCIVIYFLALVDRKWRVCKMLCTCMFAEEIYEKTVMVTVCIYLWPSFLGWC